MLVYFWGMWCSPCVETKLPELREFYEAHKTERDRFELISICCKLDAKMQTMADFDRKLKPILKAVWHGKERNRSHPGVMIGRSLSSQKSLILRHVRHVADDS